MTFVMAESSVPAMTNEPTQTSMIRTEYPWTNERTGRTEWLSHREAAGRPELRLQSRWGRRQIGRL